MLYGILNMPYEMAMNDELSRFQFYQTVQQLLEKDSQQQAEIEELKAKLQLHDAMDNQCASLMQQFRKAQEQ